MQQERIPLIIYGPQSDRYRKQLAGQSGASVVRLQSISGGAAEADSYLKFIEHNLKWKKKEQVVP